MKYLIAILAVAVSSFSLGFVIGDNISKPLSKSEYLKQRRAEVAAENQPHKMGDTEVASAGYIRQINYQDRAFLYESDYGFIKLFSPLCGEGLLPIWPGMRVTQINYRWTPDINRMSGGCYTLDYIGHDPKGDYQPK